MNRRYLNVALIIISAVVIGFSDLSASLQTKIWPSTPESIATSQINLGLDLQGGSQLDYKIDLRKVPQKDQKNIIDGILSVITKRVNSLGTSEPNIYTSDVGNEKHLIVELAGIKDLDQAKAIVGKTIQLEFKEKRQGEADPKEAEKIKAQAQTLLEKTKKGGDLKVLGQEEQLANPDTVTFNDENTFKFKDEVNSSFAEDLFKLNKGEIIDHLVENAAGQYTMDESGQLIQNTGFHVVSLIEKQDKERTISTPKTATVRHILIAYKDASKADSSVTRSQDDALKLANDIKEKLDKGAKFNDLAKEFSNDSSNKDTGGVLDTPVKDGDTTYVKEFNEGSLKLKAGEVSGPVKTEFGYHIIKADTVTEAKSETKVEPQVKFVDVFYSTVPNPWVTTDLNGAFFERAEVQFSQQSFRPFVSIKFNSEGGKLFEKLTEKNVNKPLAIFVGGQLISAPNVNEKISGGSAQISGNFTIEDANKLARDLNTGAIPAPISLAGQYTIGATLGQDALNKSVKAGLIGFMLVAIFMIAYYRLPGLLAVVALSVYTAILFFLIKFSLPMTYALLISIGVFAFLINKVLKSKDGALEKGIAVILSCFVLFFLSFLLSKSIVLTLAGIAGVILSIGMAVDANILIFERIKEELRDGRGLASAIEVGFDRAWNSIRDSNFSSLITCAILFYFGSSIIQGFAFNLAAGILVSMFTAITITKTLITALSGTKLAENLWLFGAPKHKEKKLLSIVQNRKTLYWISGILLIVSMIGLPFFGLKMGLDFTGGTLMEFQFADKVPTVEELKAGLVKSADTVQAPAKSIKAGTDSVSLSSNEEKVDFTKAHFVPTEKGYLVKTQHLSSEIHDKILVELKKNISNKFEETRFSTVGPTVGESLRYKAIFAVVLASIMIIAYIAFAFRRVPQYIGRWRFGVTAIAALVHDLGIMVGIYVYFGVVFGVEVDALFITALLTILGFSVHDTIVVFDRIREKLKYQKKDESFEEIANQAVNETIARSINTSFSVLLTMLALAFFGAESIKFFVLSIIVGIICGTYSSIFVATPLLVDWQKYSQNKK